MTRWLEAATRAEWAETKPTKPTKPEPQFEPPVLSEKSVLSAGDLNAEAAALWALLEREGPQTYGAAAVALGIGATRAWRAEAELRRAGRIRLGRLGRAIVLNQAE